MFEISIWAVICLAIAMLEFVLVAVADRGKNIGVKMAGYCVGFFLLFCVGVNVIYLNFQPEGWNKYDWAIVSPIVTVGIAVIIFVFAKGLLECFKN